MLRLRGDAEARVLRTVDLRTVLETWDTSSGAIVSYVGLGVALLLFCFASGLEVYEDNPTVHVVQHMLVMMAVPPLLAFGHR